MSATPKLEDYTIVWFCPLSIEVRAARLMLDERHKGVPARSTGQSVLYHLGKIACHNVAIAGYPAGEYGIGASGHMVAEALRDFPNLEAGFLVGIAAGMPSSTRDIRLGDVVVATPEGNHSGVIGYDLAKVEDEGVTVKQWQNSTHPLLRSAISMIRDSTDTEDPGFEQHLEICETKKEFQRPVTPSVNPDLASGADQRDFDNRPYVHYGTILSGNSVIKSRAIRDQLQEVHGGLAIEMEAAGMTTKLPVAVIRGISDFADSRKNDDWHPYAAIAAAAYAKEMLLQLGPIKKTVLPASLSAISPQVDQILMRNLPERRGFVGRENELIDLEKLLVPQQEQLPQKSIVALWGICGAGKSQLAAEFVRKQYEKRTYRSIFWIKGDSRVTFEQSIAQTLRCGDEPSDTNSDTTDDAVDRRARCVDSFFEELNRSEVGTWLLVIDGIEEGPKLDQGRDDLPGFDVHSYLKRLSHGSVIVTSRSRNAVRAYHQNIRIAGLSEEEVVEMVKLEFELRHTHEKDIRELAQLLEGLPLALRIAISVISQYSYTVAYYIEHWKKREVRTGILGADTTLLRTFEISFEKLDSESPETMKLLILFSFLDHRDLWFDLCLSVRESENESEYPEWLRKLASDGKPFEEYHAPMVDLGFVQITHSTEGEVMCEIHPAIHAYARQRVHGQEAEYARCAVLLVADNVPRSSDKTFWKTAKRLKPHADQCSIHMARLQGLGRTKDLGLINFYFANLYRLLGEYERARDLYHETMNGLNKDDLSPFDIDFKIGILINLGLVYQAQREHQLSIRCFEAAAQHISCAEAQDDDAKIELLYNKAISLLVLERLDDAEEDLGTVALYYAQQIANPANSRGRRERLQIHLRVLNDLGEVYLRKGQTTRAEAMFQDILKRQREVWGPQHPNMLAVQLNLGRTNTYMTRFGKAREIFTAIIDKYTEWWGRAHPATMRAVTELAITHMHHGRCKITMGDSGKVEIEKARELLTESLRFYGDMYGEESVLVGQAKYNLRLLHSYDMDNRELEPPQEPEPRKKARLI